MIKPPQQLYLSIFWPVEFLALCLGVSTVFYLYDLNEARLTADRELGQLVPQGEQALAAKKRFINLVTEINHVGEKDPIAAHLLTEFNIQLRAANPAPAEAK
jgi:hypothetical protein